MNKNQFKLIIDHIDANTDATNRLHDAILALVEGTSMPDGSTRELTEPVDFDDEENHRAPTHYLDGTPV